MTYERAHLRAMRGYVPGIQPRTRAIKLNTNENPYPPSPAVMARLAAITAETLQRYPDPTADAFRAVAAAVHRVTSDHVVVTNGGDELLRLALTTYLDPGRPLGVLTPGYGLYPVLAEIHQAPLSAVAFTGDWLIPDNAAEQWNAAGARLAIITNPHAPSGVLAPLDTLDRLATTFRGVLVIDEAYVDFIDPALRYDATSLLSRHRNVLLLRTLSKGYSLAGLRLAYGLGDPQLVAPVQGKTKDSYNVDAIAQALGVAALEDGAAAAACWASVREARSSLERDLNSLGFDCQPSQANFLLVTVPPEQGWSTARDIYDQLMDRNVYVRWFNEEKLSTALRVSIGTPEENRALVETLRELRD